MEIVNPIKNFLWYKREWDQYKLTDKQYKDLEFIAKAWTDYQLTKNFTWKSYGDFLIVIDIYKDVFKKPVNLACDVCKAEAIVSVFKVYDIHKHLLTEKLTKEDPKLAELPKLKARGRHAKR